MGIPDFITRQLGANPEGIARFRLGRGVLGNTTYAFWAAIAGAVAMTVALRNEPSMALIADGGIAVVFLIYLFGTYAFAHTHPDMAMLGDMEWLQWYKDQMGAKDRSIVIDQRPITGVIENTRKDA
jgi:hypothetical protein